MDEATQGGDWTPAAHEERLNKFKDDFLLPEWTKSLPPCPECDSPISARNIRAMGVDLSARFCGDLVVAVMCPKCYAGFSFHWRRSCKTMDEFLDVLAGGHPSAPKPDYQITAAESNLSAIMLEETRTCSPKERNAQAP